MQRNAEDEYTTRGAAEQSKGGGSTQAAEYRRTNVATVLLGRMLPMQGMPGASHKTVQVRSHMAALSDETWTKEAQSQNVGSDPGPNIVEMTEERTGA
ncbi:unnamed protein product [Parajaminaea phylloscopi]